MKMKRKIVFIDRDGVICEERKFLKSCDEVKLISGSAEGIKLLNDSGCKVIVITNQGGINKGRYTHEHVTAVNGFIEEEFNKVGVKIEEFFYCPHHNAKQACLCRKPDSLLIEIGLYKYNVDPSKSYFIGDKWRDVECGEKAGVKGLKIDVNVISDSLINLID